MSWRGLAFCNRSILDAPVPPSRGGGPGWIFGAKVAERDYYRALLDSSVLGSLAFADANADERETFGYAGKPCERFSPFALPREAKENPFDVVLTEYSEADIWSIRARYLPAASIVANTHSMNLQDSLVQIGTCLTWDLYRPFDAIVCSSQTAKQTVSGMFEHLQEGLRRKGLGRREFQRPRLAVIPFGVEIPEGPPIRDRARRALRFSKDDVVILSFGRLSHVNKADLMAMLVPLARVVREAKPCSVKVVIAGNDVLGLSTILRKLGQSMGLDENVLSVIADPDQVTRERLYTASDIFISLADNIQETFGLTILEAMAHGLPIVASDWGGYRDLILDGETGFLVPTAWTPDFEDLDALAGLSVVHHHEISRRVARQTAVDVVRTEAALSSLIRDPSLRRTMSAQAKKHVRSHFSWPVVARAHKTLWSQLRKLAPKTVRPQTLDDIPGAHAHAKIFGHYPTIVVAAADRIAPRRDTESRSRDNPLFQLLDATARKKLKRLLNVVGDRETSIERCILEAEEFAMTPAEAKEYLMLAIKYGLLVHTPTTPLRNAAAPRGRS